MSSCDTTPALSRRMALAGLVLLAGCGFVPAYAPGTAPAALIGATVLTVPQTRDGARLLARLQDRLGPAQAERFRLAVTLTIAEEPAAVGQDGTIRQTALTGTADFVLTTLPGGAEIVRGRERALAGFGSEGSTVATAAASDDARERLAVMLADGIMLQLAALDPGG